MSLMPKGMAKQHAREPGHVSVRNKTVAMVDWYKQTFGAKLHRERPSVSSGLPFPRITRPK